MHGVRRVGWILRFRSTECSGFGGVASILYDLMCRDRPQSLMFITKMLLGLIEFVSSS